MLVVASCLTLAQAPRPQGSHESKTVTLPFFVTDGHGSSTSATTHIDLSVLDSKIPLHSGVSIQAAKNLPLRLGILIDNSNSEASNGLYKPGVRATSELVSQLLQEPEDKVFVVSFSDAPDVSGFMSRDEFLKFQPDLVPGGGTALFDAVYVACKKRMQADPVQPSRRVIVILSDGDDNMSHVTLDEAVAAALEARTVIFAVNTRENSNRTDSVALSWFADKTGGDAFLYPNFPKVLPSIREQIENMYSVTFVPADVGKPSRYHSIELRDTSDAKMKLRAPKGYYVSDGVR
jgi:VWFA-related protein